MPIEAGSGLARLAGSRPVRSVVNSAFVRSARRRSRRGSRGSSAIEQARQLRDLLWAARHTRFGRDHGFSALLRQGRGNAQTLVSAYQRAVPLRTYEQIWTDYLKPHYPVFEDLTWPGRIPYLALTSGTTQGATKYIPVSRAMLASNRRAARAMVALHMAQRPDSKLFLGKLFFLGGSTALQEPAPGVKQGDLSAIAALEAGGWLRPYAFPPLDVMLDADWDRKLSVLAERSLSEPISLVSGVPSWLLVLFQRVLELAGKSTLAEVWPGLEVVVHGGVKFEPYRPGFEAILGDPAIRLQETYPCSEGFIGLGDPETDRLRLLLDGGLFYELVPLEELDSSDPTRHWIGSAEVGVNYAIVVSTCAGLWSHVVGDTVRLERLDPPLLTFTGRTKYTLSAFGEHLISEEMELAIAHAAERTRARVLDWHVGPVFTGALGYHRYLVEFLRPPGDLGEFRRVLDADLQARNADYAAHRAEGVGLPEPEVRAVQAGGFESWMRAEGKLGGQHKVPRVDGEGRLHERLARYLDARGFLRGGQAGDVPDHPERAE